MKVKHLKEVAAASFLTAALVNGIYAHSHEEEANKAKGVEQTYISQGNQQQAAEWAARSNDEEHDRNISLGALAIDLGVGALAAAASIRAVRRREQEQAPEPNQPASEA